MMGPTLILRALQRHRVGTLATILGIGLATGLFLSVWILRCQAAETFARSTGGFDAVLGARGSRLQLVLSALFHLDNPPGTVPLSEYRHLAEHPSIARAVPLASGDNYRGWRIVGTTTALFTDSVPDSSALRLSVGRLFRQDAHEAVLGSLAARRLGLSVGDHFHPSHGLHEAAAHEHEESYEIVGILASSNSPADRVLWIPLEGVQGMSGHDPDRAEDLTAILLKFRSPAAGFSLDRQYNRSGGSMTLAFPVGAVVAELFLRFSWMERVLGGVAWLVVLVATGSILAALTNTLEGRRRDMAILRALGAPRGFLFRLLLGEAALIGTLGALLGLLFHAGFAGLGSLLVRNGTGVSLEAWPWNPVFLWGPAAVVVIALLSGLWPAFRVSTCPVSEALQPPS